MSGYNNGGETDWLDASEVESYPMARYDHFWNDDGSKFKAVKLLWWDDASYIAYQAGDIDDGEGQSPDDEGSPTRGTSDEQYLPTRESLQGDLYLWCRLNMTEDEIPF